LVRSEKIRLDPFCLDRSGSQQAQLDKKEQKEKRKEKRKKKPENAWRTQWVKMILYPPPFFAFFCGFLARPGSRHAPAHLATRSCSIWGRFGGGYNRTPYPPPYVTVGAIPTPG
jgi:hypothetical protein